MKEKHNITFIQNDHLTPEGISLYVDGIILSKTGQLPDEILEHVEVCEFCRNEVFATCEIVRTQDYFIDLNKHPYFSKNTASIKVKSVPLKILIPIAASILILLGIFYLTNLKKNTAKNIVKNNIEINQDVYNNRIVTKSDSTQRNNDTLNENNIIAQNTEKYKINELLESLIESEFRSDEFEIQSPSNGKQFAQRQKIGFKWKNPENYILTLIIYNNSFEKVFEEKKIEGQSFNLHQFFTPGLYYWKILQDDELLAVGKFIIK